MYLEWHEHAVLVRNYWYFLKCKKLIAPAVKQYKKSLFSVILLFNHSVKIGGVKLCEQEMCLKQYLNTNTFQNPILEGPVATPLRSYH